MQKIVTLVAAILRAGGAWQHGAQHSAVAGVNAKPVATPNAKVKSFSTGHGAAPSAQMATVELPGGTIVEAYVPPACPVWVGQVVPLAVFQPGAAASKIYVFSQ